MTMASRDDHLKDLAERFTTLSDAERLDHAAVMARSFRTIVDDMRAGNLDGNPAVYERFSGAAEALEAITAGRTSGEDTDRADDTEGES